MTPPAETVLRATRDGAVLVLTLDGAATRNSLALSLYAPVQEALAEAARDPAIRAVVLTGAGGFFCSGGNIQSLQASAEGTMDEARARTDRLHAMIRALRDCPLPVIAAVEGGAAGAGVSLALACDLIVAAEDALFTVAYVRVGLSPDGGATWFLRGALPHQMAMELCVLGQPVGAARLAGFGVVNRVVPPGTARESALALARQIALGPARAIRAIKGEIAAAPLNPLDAHLDMEAEAMNRARFGPEAAEGLRAFLEKRPPDFSQEDP
ncbi:MAG: enoyl-CoA hydratase [Pararhodobacter sp.]